MPTGLLWFHPALQALATLLGLYALLLGLIRFRINHLRANHLGAKARFPWKRHVLLGLVTHLAWLAGLVGGLAMTALFWGGPFVLALHSRLALALLACVAVGLTTGLYMDHNKAKRTLLPLVHGLANLAGLGLAVALAVTGAGVIRNFLL